MDGIVWRSGTDWANIDHVVEPRPDHITSHSFSGNLAFCFGTSKVREKQHWKGRVGRDCGVCSGVGSVCGDELARTNSNVVMILTDSGQRNERKKILPETQHQRLP